MRIAAILAVVLSCAIVGCDSQPAADTENTQTPVAVPPPPPPPGDSSPSAESAQKHEFTPMLLVHCNRVETDDAKTIVSKTVENPSSEQIGEALKSLDWSDPKLDCAVWIAWKMTDPKQSDAIRQKGMLVITGVSRPPKRDSLLKAQWQANGSLESPPLESLDQAIALLVSFCNEDGKWKTMAEWKKLE